ncbi:hypothetical protein PISMIDRAFT_671996 [Pisolithus microcarpus 441]|uniref:Secreted protein n=1 Tax=Pisolithus microcarpus 441 TaxID=765257 RepID=A0A0D0A6G2_9AGAM|nr:hypothetical protein PISMIDRAFT_671996 [Pisolithus microcarpus 441]
MAAFASLLLLSRLLSSSEASLFALSLPRSLPFSGVSSKVTLGFLTWVRRAFNVDPTSLPSSRSLTPISLPSRGVNGGPPLLDSPVELGAGLSPRTELLATNGRCGINCDP